MTASKPDANSTSPGSSSPNKSAANGKVGINGIAVAASVIVLAVGGLLIGRQWFGPEPASTPPSATQTAAIGGPFALVDHNGQSVTDATFHGSYKLVYFGYTYCPDVCPTSLIRNAEALDLLGEKADAVVPILISVDPQRDTTELLKTYVPHFHPRLVGLTGSPEQVAEAAKAYRVYYARVDEEGKETGADSDTYLVDHSTITYLMGPDGQFIQHFSHSMDADAMAAKLKDLL